LISGGDDVRSRNAVLAAALIISPFGAQGADPMMWWQRGFFAQEDEAIAEVAAAFEQRTGNQVELVQLKQDEMLDQAPADASARHTCVKHAKDADSVDRQQRRPQRGYSRSGLAGRPDPMADERFLVKIHIPDKELLRRLRSYDFDVIRQTVREKPEGGYSADAILSMDEVRTLVAGGYKVLIERSDAQLAGPANRVIEFDEWLDAMKTELEHDRRR
jgi:hypothetical protein